MKLLRRLERLREAAVGSAGPTQESSVPERPPPGEGGGLASEPPPTSHGLAPAASEREVALSRLRGEWSALRERLDQWPAAMSVAQAAGPAESAVALPVAPLKEEAETGWQEVERGLLFRSLSLRGYAARCGLPWPASLVLEPATLATLGREPGIIDAGSRSLVFFDTETTGLGGGSYAFLAGLASLDRGGEWRLEQWFLADPSVEALLLEAMGPRFGQASGWVSFNGKSFDLPLLQARRRGHGLGLWPQRPHLDLLHLVRRIHGRRWPRQGQRDVEQGLLGFARQGDLPGSEMAACYHAWLREPRAPLLDAVAGHNALDVAAMVALCSAYGQSWPALLSDRRLVGEDLVRVARVLRASSTADGLLWAERALELACARGAEHAALWERAHLHRQLGRHDRAAADLEVIANARFDEGCHLELSKLYEHRLKQPEQALAWMVRGTGEAPALQDRRRARLARKVAARS